MFSSKRLEKIVDDIFALSPAVRYAEFFDGRCRRLAGGMRPGVKSLEPAKTAAKIDVETAKYATLLQKQKKYYGNFSHMFVETEKVNVLVVPYRTGVLVLTTNPPTGLELLPEVKKRLSAYSRPSLK